MSDESRALLDELFGRDRNLPKELRKRDDHYWDEQVIAIGDSVGLQECPGFYLLQRSMEAH